MPFCVSVWAAMPPDAPEPMIRTSYSVAAMIVSLQRIDRKPVQALAAEAAASAAGRCRLYCIRANSGGGANILLGGAQKARQRIGRRIVGPGRAQRRQKSVGLDGVHVGEGFAERLRAGIQRVETGAIKLLAVGRRFADQEVEKLRAPSRRERPGAPFTAGSRRSLSFRRAANCCGVKKCGRVSAAESASAVSSLGSPVWGCCCWATSAGTVPAAAIAWKNRLRFIFGLFNNTRCLPRRTA